MTNIALQNSTFSILRWKISQHKCRIPSQFRGARSQDGDAGSGIRRDPAEFNRWFRLQLLESSFWQSNRQKQKRDLFGGDNKGLQALYN